MGSLFTFISNPLEQALAILAIFVGSAGIAIILFTIIIRLILSPLQIIQLRSARAMQRLQPHIQELRKKHGKDRQKLTEETMALYKEHHVNPAMGCLPMLLQFPVLIGLFWALRDLGASPTLTVVKTSAGKTLGQVTKSIARAHASCFPTPIQYKPYSVTPKCWDALTHHKPSFWLDSTYHASLFGASHATQVWNLFHAQFLWLSNGLGQHDPLYILPVLAGVTQWIQSRMMMQKSSDPQQQTMNLLMNFTPLIIVFFAANYASGLSLYWVTSTVIGILVSMRITGWGSLPRPSQIFAPQSTTTPLIAGLMPKPPSRPNVSRSTGADVNGSATDADVVLENEDSNTTVRNPNDTAKPKSPTRRRGGRRGGGRRG